MEPIFDQLERCPPGSLSLDDYESFSEWAQNLKLLDHTKALRETFLRLLGLMTRLEAMDMAPGPEDEAGEAEATASSPVRTAPAPVPVKSIKVKRAGSSSQRPDTVEGAVQPKVNHSSPLYCVR